MVIRTKSSIRAKQNMQSCMGIDPGASGAIAIINTKDILLYDMPILLTTTEKRKHTIIDEQGLKHIIKVAMPEHVFIEKAQSMPGQGVSGMFNYGCGYGIIRGICVGLNIPYTLIHPSTWKKVMMKDMDKGKDASIARAKQLFPQIELNRKKDHGKADALLIAFYGKGF